MNNRLTVATIDTPDFAGWNFYVEAGRAFDADDYAAAYNLNRHEIDPASIHAAQDAAARLKPGEWIEVSHT